MKIDFTKAVASGNDFIIINNNRPHLAGVGGPGGVNFGDLAQFICKRKYSVGADGLLVLEESNKADFKMRIFNPDGSEVTMCGNGIRCSALYAYTKKWCASPMKIETLAGTLEASVSPALSDSEKFSGTRKGGVSGDSIRLKMTDPKDIKLNQNIGVGKTVVNFHAVDTGVPHAVHFVEDITKYPVKAMGAKIRYHKIFEPEGINADFVEIQGKSNIAVRTYERGVEDETLACGTGVVASAIISHLTDKVEQPVSVLTESKEILKVYFKKEINGFKDVYLEGKAAIIFEGGLEYV